MASGGLLPIEYPSFTLTLRWLQIMRKAHFKASVCIVWASVVTWRHNVADSIEDDPLPL